MNHDSRGRSGLHRIACTFMQTPGHAADACPPLHTPGATDRHPLHVRAPTAAHRMCVRHIAVVAQPGQRDAALPHAHALLQTHERAADACPPLHTPGATDRHPLHVRAPTGAHRMSVRTSHSLQMDSAFRATARTYCPWTARSVLQHAHTLLQTHERAAHACPPLHTPGAADRHPLHVRAPTSAHRMSVSIAFVASTATARWRVDSCLERLGYEA